MIGNIVATNSISFILVFLEGILSFFSPCVIPLIPVYMSILAGSAKNSRVDGRVTYERKKVFLHTLFFIIGVSFAFFILGMSFTALGKFFSSNKLMFTRIGGILIIFLGLFQLGIFDFNFLQRERKININFADKTMNPFLALIMGFTFSFAWTPCIGPALSSVLIMASGASTALSGNLLVLVYALGFLIPFLVLGLFTSQVLNFLKEKQKLLKYTIKTGGIILIIMGIMTFTGWVNGVSSYLNSIGNNQQSTQENTSDDTADTKESENDTKTSEDSTSNNSSDTATSDEDTANDVMPAVDFTLTDQYGNEHTLSDYKGKVVFLNFWATWCPPCNQEMPHIEELYQEYNLNQDEVVFLGVTNPKSDAYPNNSDETKEYITSFLESNEYTFPTVFDETGELFLAYSISAFPTTFMIDKEGNVAGYVPGMMTKDIMKNVINQVLDSTN
ncbi:cytochrome c biogenesis protein CcdA [Lachnotalea glycerini]|uniref:Cytochrome c biogenesis protein CcdA n=1 Tax=Lachnotalea glycerini TaxID=1763509 RepID=A0A318EQP8_9FIRM|nr:cytochrome c biogenesis protein CcdA [Lachnotalea glycerini]PXV93276.1 cytochrome c biogenesis protein CcdA [Lachnotalea glycerini]